MTKFLLAIMALIAIVGCGGNTVQDAWESAGAKPGWYGFRASGFSVGAEKPNADAIPGFWGHREFDLDRLDSLPIPPEPFALHFGGSALTDSHLEQLKRFHAAEYLGLNVTRITDAGLSHVLAFPNLRTLDLGYADVGDEGMETLSKVPKLRTLIASSTNISDEGADAISRIKTLEVLDVSHTAVTDTGLAKLATLPRLRYLGVSDIRATPAGIEAIKKQRPELEVIE